MDSHFTLTMPVEVVCLGLEVITPHNNFLRDSNDDSTAALLSFKPSIANPQSSFIGLKMIFKSTSSLDFAREPLAERSWNSQKNGDIAQNFSLLFLWRNSSLLWWVICVAIITDQIISSHLMGIDIDRSFSRFSPIQCSGHHLTSPLWSLSL